MIRFTVPPPPPLALGEELALPEPLEHAAATSISEQTTTDRV